MKMKLLTSISFATVLTMCFIFTGFGPQEQSVNAAELTGNEALTQDELKNMMVNSIDNFDSVKGEFTYHSTAANFTYEVNYEVSNIESNYWSNVTSLNTANGFEINYYFDGENIAKVDDFSETYVELPDSTSITLDPVSTLTYEDRVSTVLGGEEAYMYRDDPTNMAIAAASLFPQEITYSFLDDNSMWSIIGYESYLERNAVVIEGILDEYASEKTQSTSFKMWIDTETGILLKYETYDDSGEVMDYLVTSTITINDTAINQTSYSYAIPSGYTDVTGNTTIETTNEAIPYDFDAYVDNDNVPSSEGTNERTGFDTYKSASSSYRGDHRLSYSAADNYQWYSTSTLTVGSVSVYAYLDSADFINPSALYYYGVESQNDSDNLNQYSAPEGWNLIGTYSDVYRPAEPRLYAKVYGDYNTSTGADGIWFDVVEN